ncbi:hypothetical protein OV079_01825 [Nannocystis pusilla]|uniref:Uncharacterized protein n=1 Tax=Nannocystis pusilla TaxID=889268 RepID=A0A9X3ES05_9BACT|nr:hypothetical protein [Nannocystis pusilla]MCY1004323.1 hypothetical protein [Nannocystis pusilla]
MRTPALLFFLATHLACNTPEDPPAETLRGARYCEIFLGTADLAAGTVAVDVYNTQQLNDCPEDAWAALDVAALEAELAVDAVILNGPRYWTIDAFDRASLLDPEIRSFGGIDMRKVGALTLTLADVAGGGKPYTPRTVARETVWRLYAGKPVYELVDADGAVHVMQSYSDQKFDQDEAALAELGDVLAPPAGWSFRVRVPTEDLLVEAVDGLAVVVQDDRANTYQRAQP